MFSAFPVEAQDYPVQWTFLKRLECNLYYWTPNETKTPDDAFLFENAEESELRWMACLKHIFED
jgi:hypothetical protein